MPDLGLGGRLGDADLPWAGLEGTLGRRGGECLPSRASPRTGAAEGNVTPKLFHTGEFLLHFPHPTSSPDIVPQNIFCNNCLQVEHPTAGVWGWQS